MQPAQTIDPLLIFSSLNLPFAGVVILAVLALLFSAYVKIATVLAIVRAGLGTFSLPSVFVTAGLAVSLSLLVMYPTINESLTEMNRSVPSSGVKATEKDQAEAINRGVDRWVNFLERQAEPDELKRFSEISERLRQANGQEQGAKAAAPRFAAVAPAFFVTQLKQGFKVGLSLFLPFLVIELLVATLLLAIGYQQLNPSFAALPLKLLLFVAVDGWSLITSNLVASFIH